MKLRFFSKNISWQRLLAVLTEINYLAIIFITPLWFAYFFPTYNIFELNKTVLFRILVWSLFFLTALGWATKNRQLHLKQEKLVTRFFKKYFFVPLFLLLGLAFGLVFSLDPIQSFFGSFERQQGLVSYLYYFVWALLIFINLMLSTESVLARRLRSIILTASLSGFLVALYGILQIFNIDFFNWPEPPYLTGRTMSTFGQPNFLASFLLLIIPLSAYLVYFFKNFYIRFFFALNLFLQVACLFFTASRGGLLAFFFVLTLGVFIILFTSRLAIRWKIIIISLTVLVGLSGLAAMEFATPGRFKESFDLKRGSLAARVFFFQAAADAIWQKPIFGYGLENSAEVFIKYYERDWALYGQVSANADRAHNLILDILLTSGFFGLALFCAWYYSVFSLGWREIRWGKDKVLALAILLALAGYVVSLFFSFTIVAGEVYFWLLFSILATISFHSERDAVNNEMQGEALGSKFICPLKKYFSAKFFWRSLLLIIIFILVGWQIKRELNALLADYYHNKIYIALGNRDLVYATALYQKAISLPINPVQRRQIAYFLGDGLSSYCRPGLLKDLAEEKIIKEKIKLLQTSLPEKSYPDIFLKAKLASCLQNEEAANYYFERATAISPELPLTHVARGYHFFLQGNLQEAAKYYQLADINLPDINNPLINTEHRQAVINYKFLMYNSLGEGYFRQGDYQRAEKFFDAAFRHRPQEYPLLKKIADCRYLLGDLEGALKYIERGAQASPRDYNWFVALAVLHFEKGETAEAIRQLEIALGLAPENEQGHIRELLDSYQVK